MDWAGLMALGLGQLRLLPEQFWALTPVELLMMAGVTPGGTPGLSRARLDALCAQFPDVREH
ncbi:MAG: phage tail assembly chaperone [Rhodobacteraceae bacterium]|nr:phage tail assembly chaperone [Paracoccaceae bacterium]